MLRVHSSIMSSGHKVAATVIYHPLLMIYILIVTLLDNTKLSIIAPLIAGLSLGPSWAVAGSIFT